MPSFFSSWRTRTTGTEAQSSGPQDGSDVATTATAATASTAQTKQDSIKVDVIDLHSRRLEWYRHRLDTQIAALSDLSRCTAEELQSKFTRSRIRGSVWHQQAMCDSIAAQTDGYVRRLKEEGSDATLRVANRWEEAATDLKEELKEHNRLYDEILAVMDRNREAGDESAAQPPGGSEDEGETQG